MVSRKALSHIGFRRLWLGQAISQLGDAFYYVSLAFMIAKLTHRNDMVGFSQALETLPFFLLGPYAGVLADRMNRRSIMLVSDLVCFGILALFALVVVVAETPPTWMLISVGGCLSLPRVFFFPAKNAAVPQLVPKDALMEANATTVATQTFMPLVGMAVSATALGALYAWSPKYFFVAAIALNSLSFLGSALFILRLPALRPDAKPGEMHFNRDFRDGLKYIAGRKEIVSLNVCMFTLTLFISPFFVIYVATNQAWFGGRPQFLAWCEFWFFFGMVISSWLAGKAKPQRVGLTYAVTTAVVGVCIVALGFAKIMWVYMGINFICGLAIPYTQVAIQTYIMATVPNEFQGRVQSVITMANMGAQPLGAGMGGVILQFLGLVRSYVLIGGGTLLSAFFAVIEPNLRKAQMPSPEHKDELAEEPVFA